MVGWQLVTIWNLDFDHYFWLNLLAHWVVCSPVAQETWIQSQDKCYQRLLRYVSRVKWSNPRKRVALFPTPWCSSYRKGSLWVTLEYSRQLDFYIYIYIYIYIITLSCWWGFPWLSVSVSVSLSLSLFVCLSVSLSLSPLIYIIHRFWQVF